MCGSRTYGERFLHKPRKKSRFEVVRWWSEVHAPYGERNRWQEKSVVYKLIITVGTAVIQYQGIALFRKIVED